MSCSGATAASCSSRRSSPKSVVKQSEITRLRDQFGHLRLREGRYTAGQIDARWSDAIEADFTAWLRANQGKLPVKPEVIREMLENHAKGIPYEG